MTDDQDQRSGMEQTARPAGGILLAPGWAARIAAAQTAQRATSPGLTLPKDSRFFSGRLQHVVDAPGAERMLDFARQGSLSHVGIDTEFRFDRPGVVIDKRHTAYDPRSVRPLLLSVALAEPGADGQGGLYPFVLDLRQPAVLPALAGLLRLPVTFVSHFARAELFCLWQLGLPEPRTLWDTWVHEKAVHLGLRHKKYQQHPAAGEAEEARARERAEEDRATSPDASAWRKPTG
jgi:DNA polymerase-1